MKKFLIHILIGVISVLLVFITLSELIDFGLKINKYEHSYIKLNRLIQKTSNEKIAIFGSSRAEEHFSPIEIEKGSDLTCYNYGIAGAHFILQSGLIKAYLLKKELPQIIILEAGVSSYGNPNHILEKNRFLPYLSDTIIYNSLSKIDSELWKDRYIPFYKYCGNDYPALVGLSNYIFANQLFNKVNNPLKGQVIIDREWKGDILKLHSDSNKLKLQDEDLIYGFRYIEMISNFCKKNDIKLILVYSPEYYLQTLAFKDYLLIKKEYMKLCDNKNIYFLDYTNLPICKDTTMFFDALHLNKKGSTVFNKIFLKDLVEIL